VTLARLAKPSTAGTGRELHGTPNAASRREMRHLFVANSATLGLVAAVRCDSTVGPGETDPDLDGSGGDEGAEAEHPTVITMVTAASRLPGPRPNLTPTPYAFWDARCAPVMCGGPQRHQEGSIFCCPPLTVRPWTMTASRWR
jgi:hypothetical protein